jgi:hypothetical protein
LAVATWVDDLLVSLTGDWLPWRLAIAALIVARCSTARRFGRLIKHASREKRGRSGSMTLLKPLRAPARGRTTMLISHDPTAVEWADRVIELRDGARVATPGVMTVRAT